MKLFQGTGPISPQIHNSVVAIGNFDGVHRGHQKLLGIAGAKARERGCAWGIVAFEPHPRTFFKPEEPVFRLTPLPLKSRLASALGASFVLALDFNRELSSLEAEDFVRQHLVDQLQVAHVVTGYDFHFGRGRKGNPALLKDLGQSFGFDVTIVEQVSDDGDSRSPFSSSSIRSSLRRGHVAAAARELGYFWTVMGEVVPGDARGREIGFPTANIILEPGAEPFRGIYAVRVRDEATGRRWQGAGYFGDRPTFDTKRIFLEVYLLDADEDLYGHTLIVEFIDLIRPDQKFNSIADLQAQMKDDCAKAKSILQALAENNQYTEYPLGLAQERDLGEPPETSPAR